MEKREEPLLSIPVIVLVAWKLLLASNTTFYLHPPTPPEVTHFLLLFSSVELSSSLLQNLNSCIVTALGSPAPLHQQHPHKPSLR